jgi:hypothetical protein
MVLMLFGYTIFLNLNIILQLIVSKGSIEAWEAEVDLYSYQVATLALLVAARLYELLKILFS